MAADRIQIGGLKGPHGLQGYVKVKLLLADPALLRSIKTVFLADGTGYGLVNSKPVGQGLVAIQLAGIATPEAAAALKGPVFAEKSAFDVAEDEVLLADLIGQPVVDHTGKVQGLVEAITELPAGPALVIKTEANPKTLLVPLAADFVVVTAAAAANLPPRLELTPLGLQLLTL